MRRLTVIVLGALVLAAVAAPPAAAATPPAAGTAGIDRFLTDGLAATRLPGMAVAITRGAEVVHLAGYGRDGRGAPVTPRTPFRIGSLSKSFTALRVHQLADQGRIDLDVPVRTYLPEFGTADPASADRVTVRHLLDQTSGLADRSFPALNGDQPTDAAGRVASLHDAEPVSEPGTGFHYFDPNYQVLARLVEVVGGHPFDDQLAGQVLGPLGMAHTVAAPSAQAAPAADPDLAPGHIVLFGMPVVRDELEGLLDGSGGMVSTAEDMARWLTLQITGSPALVSAAGLADMHTPAPGVPGGYAQGWEVGQTPGGVRRIQHTGVLSTYSAVQVLLPDSGYAFVLLFDGNSAMADTAGLATGLVNLLTGRPPAGVRGTLPIAVTFGALMGAVLARRGFQLVRVRRWRRRTAVRPVWRTVAGLVWLLLPAVFLPLVPALVEVLADRSFTLWQLALAMPDVLAFLAAAALAGLALAAARALTLTRPTPGRGQRTRAQGASGGS